MPFVPETFPCFPPRNGYSLPANFLLAHDTISNVYRHALRVSNQEDADPLQLIFHHDAIADVALPLLEAIENDPSGIELENWLVTAATALGSLSERLLSYRNSIQSR